MLNKFDVFEQIKLQPHDILLTKDMGYPESKNTKRQGFLRCHRLFR
ncbi:MAG: hypothetical protein IPG53_17625 [Ignavibacteriales bacterium]|nr:hypothetical protein [Ignavibacteriales bacterium]